MNSTSSSHVPFAQLPPEARVLFSILLMTIYGPERPAVQKVLADLEMIWDGEQLALDNFRKPGRMKEVFDTYAAILREEVWGLDSIGVSREEAEREGFFALRRSRRCSVNGSPKAA
jgi:hypothetical protein